MSATKPRPPCPSRTEPLDCRARAELLTALQSTRIGCCCVCLSCAGGNRARRPMAGDNTSPLGWANAGKKMYSLNYNNPRRKLGPKYNKRKGEAVQPAKPMSPDMSYRAIKPTLLTAGLPSGELFGAPSNLQTAVSSARTIAAHRLERAAQRRSAYTPAVPATGTDIRSTLRPVAENRSVKKTLLPVVEAPAALASPQPQAVSLQPEGLPAAPSSLDRNKALAALRRARTHSLKPAIVILTGAFNPMHLGHLLTLEHACEQLEKVRPIAVVAALFHPAHDDYSAPLSVEHKRPHTRPDADRPHTGPAWRT